MSTDHALIVKKACTFTVSCGATPSTATEAITSLKKVARAREGVADNLAEVARRAAAVEPHRQGWPPCQWPMLGSSGSAEPGTFLA